MNHQQEIVIKKSPVVFLKWLIIIEFTWAIITTLLILWIDFDALYASLQLARVASFQIIVAGIITSLQVLFVAIAFISWYFDTYKIDRHKIVRQRGNFTGTSDIVQTKALTDVVIHQSRLGSSLNYGSLELITVDAKRKIRLKNIPNPARHAELIQNFITPQQIDLNRQLQKPIPALISEGEGQYIEFKSSFSWDYRQQRINKALNKAIMKNVVGFMNTTGGAILIGVDDEGEILGLETEFQSMGKGNVDGFENALNLAFGQMVGTEYRHFLTVDFAEIEGKTICRIIVSPAPEPVFLTHKNSEEFYIRTGNSSQPLTMSKAVRYIQSHFN